MATKSEGGKPPPLKLIETALNTPKPAPRVGKLARQASEIEEPTLPMLPAGCPVKPLGKSGQVCHFLDEMGQLVSLDPQKIGKNHIRNLFGRRSELCDTYWPRLNDRGEPKGKGQWHPEIAGDELMRACAFAGFFDVRGKVRERGAHRGRSGELILHCGDKIYVAGEVSGYHEPDVIDGFVYPAAAGIPRPDPVVQSSSPAETLSVLLRTWKWERELVDPMLLLGWIGCAMIGGALDWRPHAWITGSSATGKSTLQKVLELVFDGGALHTHDASEASIRQILGQQTLPVFFDEIEAEEDNRRNKAVIKLARLASSGGTILRGGQDHVGHEFKAQSCFLFSSILTPPMTQQDRNRLAILELKKFIKDETPPEIDEAEIRATGRQIRKRLADEWPRLEAVLAKYRQALAKHGHGGRSQDQFGTLLAVADVLLYDVIDELQVEFWAKLLAADTLAEKTTELVDEEEAVNHLATSFMVVRGGDEPEPIVRHIVKALELEGDKARERLENVGLRIVQKTDGKDGAHGAITPRPATAAKDLYLAIADSHVGLERIFANTRWNEGTWRQSLGRVDAAVRRVKCRFGPGRPIWATLIPLPAILAFHAD